MLGVCGQVEDADMLEEFMQSDNLDDKLGLDAMIACYLTLKGKAGMPLVKKLFLDNKDADYAHSYSAIMALRFHASETEVLPRESVIEGLRCILDRNALADLVIPDLARMEDWDSLPRLVELFETANPTESWARVPIINFVRACPLPEADEAMGKLKAIDPAAVKRASTFFPFARKATPKTEESDSTDKSDSDSADETKVDADATTEETNKTSANDVPQQTLYARTVSAEIALPDLGDDVLATADEFAGAVQGSPVTMEANGESAKPYSSGDSNAAESPSKGWLPLAALAGAGLILISLVDWRGARKNAA